MDSLSGVVLRNRVGQLSGTLTANNYNMSGTLGAIRVYPIVPTQEKTVVSSLEQQTVLPDGNNKLSKVIVEALPVTREVNAKGGYTVTIGA